MSLAQHAACIGATRSAMVQGQVNLLALAQRAAGPARRAVYPCFHVFLSGVGATRELVLCNAQYTDSGLTFC
ncbi:hypothetical protein A2U01_0105727 [Trifolium medium]|uniref:Uncharacterized protein n=1 Tax=Trifolium medium TaxID=97028 RepID=A0A392VB21_9FABA|nr:hypothetical protein [Trifolium medium]